MSDVHAYLWLIPALPLFAAVLITFLGYPVFRQHSHWVCIGGAVGACILSVMLLTTVRQLPHDTAIESYYTWFQAGTVDVGFSLRADALTAIMLVMVTFIGSLIAIYAAGYMHGDPGYPRFFAEVALFLFSMTGLVLANNFILLYAFWEGVGVCSFLLIGFWFTRPSAAAAARKAFLVTRIGDLGFFIGILLLWKVFGFSLDYYSKDGYSGVFERLGQASQAELTAICLLLFCGAVGKSAQFPLHVWLPDAMEGPTPVSALIHAATMVTAGVYMVARCTPLFVQAPDAQLVVAIIGGTTALLAALIALTQNDLKRVLAYSTVSQLGYMFLALGSGIGATLAPLAATAAMFHLFTHAFFKALLFLAAGSVMHAMGNVIDMRRFGGLRHLLKTTHWTFLCGAAALAGVPFLSGFWSKDEVLGAVLSASEHHHHAAIYLILLVVALVTAGLTAFYTFRAYFMTFWGEERIPHEAGHHAHESPPMMTVPLMILAVFAVGVGIVVEPFTHWFSGFLLHTPGLNAHGEEHAHSLAHTLLPVLGGAMALGGIAVAWWMYVRQVGVAGQLAARFQALYQLSLNKFHMDELYDTFVVKPLEGFAEFCRIFDLYVVDGLVDIIGQIPRLFGYVFRPIQNGLVQFYALAMMLGLTVFLVALVWRYGW